MVNSPLKVAVMAAIAKAEGYALDGPDDPHYAKLADAALSAIANWTPTDDMIKAYDGPRGAAEYGMDKYHPDFVRDAWAELMKAATTPTT